MSINLRQTDRQTNQVDQLADSYIPLPKLPEEWFDFIFRKEDIELDNPLLPFRNKKQG